MPKTVYDHRTSSSVVSWDACCCRGGGGRGSGRAWQRRGYCLQPRDLPKYSNFSTWLRACALAANYRVVRLGTPLPGWATVPLFLWIAREVRNQAKASVHESCFIFEPNPCARKRKIIPQNSWGQSANAKLFGQSMQRLRGPCQVTRQPIHFRRGIRTSAPGAQPGGIKPRLTRVYPPESACPGRVGFPG